MVINHQIMIGITIVLKTLATNKPWEALVEKKAEIKETRYMERINTMPVMAAVRFTLFIKEILSWIGIFGLIYVYYIE